MCVSCLSWDLPSYLINCKKSSACCNSRCSLSWASQINEFGGGCFSSPNKTAVSVVCWSKYVAWAAPAGFRRVVALCLKSAFHSSFPLFLMSADTCGGSYGLLRTSFLHMSKWEVSFLVREGFKQKAHVKLVSVPSILTIACFSALKFASGRLFCS